MTTDNSNREIAGEGQAVPAGGFSPSVAATDFANDDRQASTVADSARDYLNRLRGGDGNQISLTREENIATFRHSGQQDRRLPLVRRPLGDELAEELRRLTSAPIYARALAAATGVADIDQRPAKRVHIWRDPAAVAHANQ